MPAVEANISTSRPARFIKQLRDHAEAMSNRGDDHRRPHSGDHPAGNGPDLRVDGSEDSAVLTFGPIGRCIATADGDALNVRIEAGDAVDLDRIQQIISRDLERFGHRDRFTITWHPVPGAGA